MFLNSFLGRDISSPVAFKFAFVSIDKTFQIVLESNCYFTAFYVANDAGLNDEPLIPSTLTKRNGIWS